MALEKTDREYWDKIEVGDIELRGKEEKVGLSTIQELSV